MILIKMAKQNWKNVYNTVLLTHSWLFERAEVNYLVRNAKERAVGASLGNRG